jgi:HlyD family secretion protein
VQNVVIYTAIISVENPRLELLPGMTASLRVETDRHNNVLRVPNAALRWRPPSLTTEQQPVAQVASADPGDAPMPAAGGGRAGGPNAGGPNARGGNIAELFDALRSEAKLSPEQVKAIDAVLADTRAGARGAGEQTGAQRGNARSPRQDLQERVTAILDPEQRAKFEEIRQRFIEGRGDRPASQAGRVFVVGPDGKAKGVTIRIGSTDGGNTEVISGLEPGADVITGGGPRAEASPSVLRRFGF